MAQEDVFKKLVSHCKEYGFVFPSSDIYDGLGAVYDYGQMGVELKNNIKQYWRQIIWNYWYYFLHSVGCCCRRTCKSGCGKASTL